MPAAKSGGGKKAKDPGKQQGAAALGPPPDPSRLKEQHGVLTNENSELKALRSQLLAKEKAMREKIEKLRAIAAATGKNLGLKAPPGGGLLLEPPKLKSLHAGQFGGDPRTPHTPVKPRMLKKFKNGFSPTKSPRKYKPMKIPVKIPKIKPSGDPELDKLRREAAVLEAQNAVLTRQRSGLRRGVKTLAQNKDDMASTRDRIVNGYKGKRSKFKMILAKHNKYKKKEQQLDKKTSKRMMEIERQFRARGLDFPNLDPRDRLESSPPKLQRGQRSHGQRGLRPHGDRHEPAPDRRTRGGSHDRHDVLRGRIRGNHSGGVSIGDKSLMRRFESHRMGPTTPKRTNLHKLRAPRRNRSKSLPRAHTQSYLRKHTRANLSKNSYSRSRRMSRQRDRPNDLDVPRRKSREVLSIGDLYRKAADDDVIVRESRRRMRRTGLGGAELMEYSSLPDLRASSERNYRNGDENQPLSRVIEEPINKSKQFGSGMPPLKRSKSDPTDRATLKRTVFLSMSADAKALEGDSTKRLVSALKELSPNAAAIVQRRADKLQHKRSKARRKSIQRQKKAARARAKGGSKTALSSVPTDAARKENIAYSQSLNNLGLMGDRRAPPERSASQQRVRETPGKDKVSRRHSLGAFDFESLYTRKAPRTRKRNKNKERSKSVHHGRSPSGERERAPDTNHQRAKSKLRSKSSEGFRSNLGTLKIKKPHGHGASGASRVTRGYRDPLDEAMSDFRKLTPENFESKYKRLHKRVKKGLVADEEKPRYKKVHNRMRQGAIPEGQRERYDDFVRSLKDGTRMATSKQGSYFDGARKKGRVPGSPDPTPIHSVTYKKRNNDWWARMNNLKLNLLDF